MRWLRSLPVGRSWEVCGIWISRRRSTASSDGPDAPEQPARDHGRALDLGRGLCPLPARPGGGQPHHLHPSSDPALVDGRHPRPAAGNGRLDPRHRLWRRRPVAGDPPLGTPARAAGDAHRPRPEPAQRRGRRRPDPRRHGHQLAHRRRVRARARARARTSSSPPSSPIIWPTPTSSASCAGSSGMPRAAGSSPTCSAAASPIGASACWPPWRAGTGSCAVTAWSRSPAASAAPTGSGWWPRPASPPRSAGGWPSAGASAA